MLAFPERSSEIEDARIYGYLFSSPEDEVINRGRIAGAKSRCFK